MNASKLNPNIFNGEERSGGYLAINRTPTSANSPHWRGKVYLAGVGWYWFSAWENRNGKGELLSLRAQEMTDEQAAKFCIPKGRRAAPQQQEFNTGNGANEPPDPGIPF